MLSGVWGGGGLDTRKHPSALEHGKNAGMVVTTSSGHETAPCSHTYCIARRSGLQRFTDDWFDFNIDFDPNFMVR